LHQVFAEAVRFAPLGLLNMFNSGGALDSIASTVDSSATMIQIKCRGPGQFGVYSSARPATCRVDAHEVEFSYSDDGLLAFDLPDGPSLSNLRNIEIMYRLF
jgi:hypothetical protein